MGRKVRGKNQTAEERVNTGDKKPTSTFRQVAGGRVGR